MKIKLQTIGNAEIEFDVTDEKKAVEGLSFWQGLPDKCGICQKSIFFTFRQPQGFTYYGLMCEGKPAHEATFGQHKEGGGLFFKGEWKEVQFGGVQAERDAEIARFSDQKPNPFAERIANAKTAIKGLGGQATPQGFNESDADYLESLTAQYKTLKSRAA